MDNKKTFYIECIFKSQLVDILKVLVEEDVLTTSEVSDVLEQYTNNRRLKFINLMGELNKIGDIKEGDIIVSFSKFITVYQDKKFNTCRTHINSGNYLFGNDLPI